MSATHRHSTLPTLTPPAQQSTAWLALLALGIVYGDIGTSPLYAAKETFNPAHGIALTVENILGGVSCIFLGADAGCQPQIRDAGTACRQPG